MTGVHNIDEATYHGDPCPEPSLSKSVAMLLLNRSPMHAWCAHPRLNPHFRRQVDEKFDLGSAFHTLVLGKGAQCVAIEADDWRTKAAKEARDAARAEGRIPMLAHQLVRVDRMVDAVKAQVAERRDVARALAAGLPERALIWREENGVWCRALLDWIPDNGPLYPDFKTTEASAGPEDWGRGVMFNTGCDVQDAFYRRGLRKVLGIDDAFLLFVVCELEAPHLIATHRCSPAAAAMADRKVETAIQIWGACLEKQRWPGYRRETAWHDAPPWHEQRWTERELSGDLDVLVDA